MSELSRVRCLYCGATSEPREFGTTPDGWGRDNGCFLCPDCNSDLGEEQVENERLREAAFRIKDQRHALARRVEELEAGLRSIAALPHPAEEPHRHYLGWKAYVAQAVDHARALLKDGERDV